MGYNLMIEEKKISQLFQSNVGCNLDESPQIPEISLFDRIFRTIYHIFIEKEKREKERERGS